MRDVKPNNNSAFKHMNQKTLPFVSKYNCSSSYEVISVGAGAVFGGMMGDKNVA